MTTTDCVGKYLVIARRLQSFVYGGAHAAAAGMMLCACNEC
jgi:hypothetical protein